MWAHLTVRLESLDMIAAQLKSTALSFNRQENVVFWDKQEGYSFGKYDKNCAHVSVQCSNNEIPTKSRISWSHRSYYKDINKLTFE